MTWKTPFATQFNLNC